MSSITAGQGNANQNHTEMPFHTRQDSYYKRKTGVGEDAGEVEPSRPADGSAQWWGTVDSSVLHPQKLLCDPAIPLRGTYPKTLKYLHTHVHIIIIHSSPKAEAT